MDLKVLDKIPREWVRKSKNAKLQYLNLPISYDIETTSFIDEDGQETAVVYSHEFSVGGVLFNFRTWEECKEFVYELSSYFTEGDMKKNIVIFVHNLAYEYQHMYKYFPFTKVFANGNIHKILYAKFDNVEFRCSYQLSGLSLNNLSKNTKHKKQSGEDFDYSVKRSPITPLTELEMSYIENDVLVVTDYIQELLDNGYTLATLPYTSTGFVRQYCREQCLSNPDYKQFYQEELTLTAEEYACARTAFMGGFTHANPYYSANDYNNGIVENCYHWDLTSSYPNVMLGAYTYPMSKGVRCYFKSVEELENTIEEFHAIFYITIDVVTDFPFPYISKSKVINSDAYIYDEDNGRVVAGKNLTLAITDIDYKLIKEIYDVEVIEIGACWLYNKGYLPKTFKQCILNFYSDKTKLKGVEGQEFNYQAQKGRLNSCYGMEVTDIIKPEYLLDEEGELYIPTKEVDVNDYINKYNESKNRFLFYPQGVFVTAHARAVLFNILLKAPDKVVYCDTDSVFTTEPLLDIINEANEEIHNKLVKACEEQDLNWEDFCPTDIKGIEHELGLWSHDAEGKEYEHYKSMKTLGAKRYMYLDDNNKYHLTVSGVHKKKAMEYLESLGNPYEEFTDMMTIPASHSGRNILTYIDELREGTLVDYLGNCYNYSEASGIHMKESSFTLNIIQKYLDYCEGYREVK